MTEAGKILQDAATTVLAESATLENKVLELSRDMKALRHYNEVLEKQVASSTNSSESKKRETGCFKVFINGNDFVFRRSFIERGKPGGQEAARLLASKLRLYADQFRPGDCLSLIVYIFANHSYQVTIDKKVQEAFYEGLNQLGSIIYVIDCGTDKEATGLKLKTILAVEASNSHVQLILIGSRSSAAVMTLSSSEKFIEMMDKVHLMAHDDLAPEVQALNMPITFTLDDIFSTTSTSGSRLPKIHGPPKMRPANYKTLPCHRFHLEHQCKFGETCTFSHEDISDQEREALHIRYANEIASSRSVSPSSADTCQHELGPFLLLLRIIFKAGGGRSALRGRVGELLHGTFNQFGYGSFREYATAAARRQLVLLLPGASAGSEKIQINPLLADLLEDHDLKGQKLAEALEARLTSVNTWQDASEAESNAGKASEVGWDS